MKKHTVGLIFSITLIVVLLASCYDLKIEDIENLDGSVTITFIHENMLGREDAPNFREDLHKFPRLGETLIADDTGIVGEGEPSFLWKRGDVTVGGSGGTYLPREEEDVGIPFTVVAFRTGHVRGMLSNPAYPVIDTDPDKTDIADVIRTVEIADNNGELEAAIDTKSTLTEDGFRYVWMRSGPATSFVPNRDFTPIRGATGKTYRPTSADRNRGIRLTVIHLDYSYYFDSNIWGEIIVGRPEPSGVEVNPPAITMAPGTGHSFSAIVLPEEAEQSVTWTVEATGDYADITQSGEFTVQNDAPSGATITVRATATGTAVSGTATVTVGRIVPTEVILSPQTGTLPAGQSLQFTATVNPPGSPQDVTWKVETGSAWSSIKSGLLTLDSNAPDGMEITVRATAMGTAVSGTATITAQHDGPFTVSPMTANLLPGETKQFTGYASLNPGGIIDNDVTWTVVPPEAGTITKDGLFTLSQTDVELGGKVEIEARSPRTSVVITATVTVKGIVITGPDSVNGGQSGRYKATVYGEYDQAVTWSLVEGALSDPKTLISDTIIVAEGNLAVATRETLTKLTVRARSTADPRLTTTMEVKVSSFLYPPQWKMVAAGHSHAFALSEDGKLFGWGNNQYRQLGIGPTTSGPQTVTKIFMGNWATVVTSRSNTLGIQKDGSLWQWGWFNASDTPKRVNMDNDWVAVSVSDTVSPDRTTILALKSDGTLWGWGTDLTFVGLASGNSRDPQQIGTDSDWQAISVGETHAVAIKTDGSMWGVGKNDNNQIGTGSLNTRYWVKANDKRWVSASAGDRYTMALDPAGVMWAWGWNDHGRLGLGHANGPNLSTPQRVFPDSSTFDAPAIGSWTEHSIVLKRDGTVWSWGRNDRGQIGLGYGQDVMIGTITTRKQMTFRTSNIAKKMRAYSTNGKFGIAIDTDGRIWTWGDNSDWQLARNLSSQQVQDNNHDKTPTMVGGALVQP